MSAVDRFSPWGLAQSGTEHGEQTALFAWVNRAMWIGAPNAQKQYWNGPDVSQLIKQNVDANTPAVPELRWLHAIPNGGERAKAVAGAMKAEGVKSGVADIFLPVQKTYGVKYFDDEGEYNYHTTRKNGLYIEMKRKNGKPSDLSQSQLDFRDFALRQGYAWCWCKGWEVARDRLIDYLTGEWKSEYEVV